MGPGAHCAPDSNIQTRDILSTVTDNITYRVMLQQLETLP